MTQNRKLNSIAAVVEAFGGTKATADWAGVSMPAVSNWVDREEIPPGWHYRMDRELRRRGFVVDPALFGDDPGKIAARKMPPTTVDHSRKQRSGRAA